MARSSNNLFGSNLNYGDILPLPQSRELIMTNVTNLAEFPTNTFDEFTNIVEGIEESTPVRYVALTKVAITPKNVGAPRILNVSFRLVGSDTSTDTLNFFLNGYDVMGAVYSFTTNSYTYVNTSVAKNASASFSVKEKISSSFVRSIPINIARGKTIAEAVPLYTAYINANAPNISKFNIQAPAASNTINNPYKFQTNDDAEQLSGPYISQPPRNLSDLHTDAIYEGQNILSYASYFIETQHTQTYWSTLSTWGVDKNSVVLLSIAPTGSTNFTPQGIEWSPQSTSSTTVTITGDAVMDDGTTRNLGYWVMHIFMPWIAQRSPDAPSTPPNSSTYAMPPATEADIFGSPDLISSGENVQILRPFGAPLPAKYKKSFAEIADWTVNFTYSPSTSTLLTRKRKPGVNLFGIKNDVGLLAPAAPLVGTSDFFLQITVDELRNEFLAGGNTTRVLKIFPINANSDYIFIDFVTNDLIWRMTDTNPLKTMTFHIFNGSGEPHPKYTSNDYIITLFLRFI
jgi:hypothetical protein